MQNCPANVASTTVRPRGTRRHRTAFKGLCLVFAVAMLATACLAGCTPSTPAAKPAKPALPASAYNLDASLPKWIDPETGYDTTRAWKLEGGDWPIAMLMAPWQSPQLITGMRDGVFQEKLKPFSITPVIEPIDLPPRTFHALQRSKWPFAYMPMAVFTDYVRSNSNQGEAGGLQYVLLAGSTAGGGYTLVARDPSIKTIKDLADKKVAQDNSNPVPAVLLAAAAKSAGLSLGDGKGQIHYSRGVNGQQINDYMAGKLDAVISLNIILPSLLARGSHVVTNFSDVAYTPNYTVLVVERSVLEQRPDVVKAFLEAHYQANKTATAEWDTGLKQVLFKGWNAYFSKQPGPAAPQRLVKDMAAFDVMLGDVHPEQRVDPRLVADCFATMDRDKLWGWDGTVDTKKLVDLGLYDTVLKENGEKPQSAASK